MKAIILAAGEGKRMQPLTFEMPKPMVPILGEPLLEHTFDILPEKIDEVILVVGYKAEQIKDYFGVVFKGKRINYVYQEKATGTGHALLLCRPYLTPGEKFLILNSDDLHDKFSVERCCDYDRALLVYRAEDPKKFGVVEVDEKNRVIGLEEKPEIPKSNLVSVGVYVLDEKIFDYEPKIHKGEYYLPVMIADLIKDLPVYAVESNFWITVSTPQDIPKAEAALRIRGAK